MGQCASPYNALPTYITGETFSHTECDLCGSRRKCVNCLEFIHEYSYVPFIIEYSSIWQEVGNIWSALHRPSPTESNQCCGTEGRCHGKMGTP